MISLHDATVTLVASSFVQTLNGAPYGGISGTARSSSPPWVALLWAVVLAACFVAIPWELFSAQGFPDQKNNLDAIDAYVKYGYELGGQTLFALLLNEYLWRELLVFIGISFQEPIDGLLCLSFIAIALLTFRIIRDAGLIYAIVFLLAPLSVDLFISQTRSALALGIFVSALAIDSKLFRYVTFVLSMFIHSFAIVLFLLHQLNRLILSSTLNARAKILLPVLLGLGASIVWAFLAQAVLAALGDRRAFQVAILPVSIPFILWWAIFGIFLIAFAEVRGLFRVQFVMLALALLALFVFSAIFGAGGLRFLSLSLPLVFIAIRSIEAPVLRIGLVTGTMMFNLFHFMYWST